MTMEDDLSDLEDLQSGSIGTQSDKTNQMLNKKEDEYQPRYVLLTKFERTFKSQPWLAKEELNILEYVKKYGTKGQYKETYWSNIETKNL